MRFRNSLRLLMDNFKNVYRLLLSKLIIGLIAAALCCSFVLPGLIEIWKSAEMRTLIVDLKEALKILVAADAEALEEIKEQILGNNGSLGEVIQLLGSMRFGIILTCVGCFVVYLLKRFADSVCLFATGSILNDKMATYAETPFFTALIANLGKATAYSAVYVPISILFDVIMLALLYVFLLFMPIGLGLFSGITAIVCCQALKLTAASHWTPAMTADNNKIFKAICCLSKKEREQDGKTFSVYLVSVYLIIIINVLAMFCTFGSALLLTVPASYFFLICLQYVDYYILKGKKYFLTYEHIATNPDHGDSEHFFDYICDESTVKEEENEKNN